jgi:hypothetical protein
VIIHALREAIIAELGAALPGAHVAAHGGTFTEDELRRYAVRSPALLVSVSDVGNLSFLGSTALGEVTIGIALVCGPGKKGQTAEGAALAALPLVLRTVTGNRWGLSGIDGPPKYLRAQNLYSAPLDAGGVALWGVSFRQDVELGAGLLDEDGLAALDDFLTVRLTQADSGDAEVVLTDDVFNVRTGESSAPESGDEWP